MARPGDKGYKRNAPARTKDDLERAADQWEEYAKDNEARGFTSGPTYEDCVKRGDDEALLRKAWSHRYWFRPWWHKLIFFWRR